MRIIPRTHRPIAGEIKIHPQLNVVSQPGYTGTPLWTNMHLVTKLCVVITANQIFEHHPGSPVGTKLFFRTQIEIHTPVMSALATGGEITIGRSGAEIVGINLDIFGRDAQVE